MPLYEYECKQCKRHTENIQKFSDAEITTCPHCGGPLERVISAPAIAFKGGGWFKDGYGNAKASAKSSETAAGESTAGSPSTDTGTAAAKTDSTPAAMPAPASAPSAPATTAASSDKK